jgi:hypothetical protein
MEDGDKQAPDNNGDRKPSAPDDSDEDCFMIKISWRESINIHAMELWNMQLNPSFDIDDTLYIKLNHRLKICVFPDPNAFYILR